MNQERTILLVGDEPDVTSGLQMILTDTACGIITASGGQEGLEIMSRRAIHLVSCGEHRPQMTGAEFLEMVKERHPATVRIMLTGQAGLQPAMDAVNKGVIFRFITKPWDDTELLLAVRSALEKYDLEEEIRRLLKIVKRQALDLKILERRYPNITRLERDRDGNLLLPEMTDEQLAEIVNRCERQFA